MTRLYWKMFVIGGFLKLLGDVTGLVLPLGISIVVSYIETQSSSEVLHSKKMDQVNILWKLYLIRYWSVFNYIFSKWRASFVGVLKSGVQ